MCRRGPDTVPNGWVDYPGSASRDFVDVRVDPNANVYEAVVKEIENLCQANKRVLIAALSDGSAERLRGLLVDHGGASLPTASDLNIEKGTAAIAVFGMDNGFVSGYLLVISESDMLGERMGRPGRRRIRPENFIAEVSSLAPGDLVVHVDHGSGHL